MPEVATLLDDDNRLVAKHGTQLMGIADYSADVPDAWFAGTPLTPAPLPSGFRNMGYITTDGIGKAADVSTSAVNMVQDRDPVRTDIDSKTSTWTVTFGEANAWTKGLYYGLPVEEWVANKAAAWEYHDGEVTEDPEYRLYVITQDRVGASAIYRVEFAYKAKVTDLGDSSLQRSDPETTEFTFTLLKDPEAGPYGRTSTAASTGVRGVAATTQNRIAGEVFEGADGEPVDLSK